MNRCVFDLVGKLQRERGPKGDAARVCTASREGRKCLTLTLAVT